MKKIIYVIVALTIIAFLVLKHQIKYISDTDIGADFAQIEKLEGEILQDFSFIDISQKKRNISEFAGQKILINLWASWCKPCLKELPELNILAKQRPELNVVVISLDTDFNKGLNSFNKLGLTNLEFYYDQANQAQTKLGVMGLPTSLILDAELKQKILVSGYLDWLSEPANLLFLENE